LPKRRLRIDFTDGDGAAYTFSVSGTLDSTKLSKIVDAIEAISPNDGSPPEVAVSDTSFDKLRQLLETKFQFGYFTSMDVLEAFEDEYNTPIGLSTVSTYLGRLEQKAVLARTRSSAGWIYKKVKTQLAC
jgi:hypothetical protein